MDETTKQGQFTGATRPRRGRPVGSRNKHLKPNKTESLTIRVAPEFRRALEDLTELYGGSLTTTIERGIAQLVISEETRGLRAFWGRFRKERAKALDTVESYREDGE